MSFKMYKYIPVTMWLQMYSDILNQKLINSLKYNEVPLILYRISQYVPIF